MTTTQRRRYWYVEKYYEGVLRDVSGSFGSYNAAHSAASELRHIYGRSGWSYAVTNRRPLAVKR